MLDKRKVRKKAFLELLSSPLTLWPALIGFTVALGAWATDMSSQVTFFAALVCLLGAVGGFFTRWLLKGDEIHKDALAEVQREIMKERDRVLDDLDARLTEDKDPRTEGLLRDLRAIAMAFSRSKSASTALKANFVFEIAWGTEKLLENCVKSLEQSLDLWQTARQLTTEEAREPILERRERIIDDVRESIAQLGKVLAGLQTIDTSKPENSNLARLRKELDQSLAVARRVEERVRELDKSIDPEAAS